MQSLYILLLIAGITVKSVAPQAPHIFKHGVQKECDDFTWGLSDMMISPNYPKNYSNDVDCRKIIQAGGHFKVRLKFLDFALEGSTNCKYDSIEIRDGPYGFSPLLFKGCGLDIRTGHTFTSTGSFMWVRFYSDSFIQSKGFRAKISASPISSEDDNMTRSVEDTRYTTEECYIVVEGFDAFQLSSENLPNSLLEFYSNNPTIPVHCVWDIRMPALSKTKINFITYDGLNTIDCIATFIEQYDISTAAGDVRHHSCNIAAGTNWLSGDRRALLHVYAKDFESFPKFEIVANVYLQAKNCSKLDMFDCFDGYCIPKTLECDGVSHCGQSYDEDCSKDSGDGVMRSEYVTLIVLVIVGSLVLVVFMTLAEAVQRHTLSKIDKGSKTLENKASISCSSITGTFRSKYNENVSFKGRKTPSIITNIMERDRIYQTPHFCLPRPQIDLHRQLSDDEHSIGSESSDRLLEIISSHSQAKSTPVSVQHSTSPSLHHSAATSLQHSGLEARIEREPERPLHYSTSWNSSRKPFDDASHRLTSFHSSC